MTRIHTKHVPTSLLPFKQEATDKAADFQYAGSTPAHSLVKVPRQDVCFAAGPSSLNHELCLQIGLVVGFCFIRLSDCICAGARVSVEEPAVSACHDGGCIILGEIHAICGGGCAVLRPARAIKTLEKSLLRGNIFWRAHKTTTTGPAQSAAYVYSRLLLEIDLIGLGLASSAVH